jgi:hypothetical protein
LRTYLRLITGITVVALGLAIAPVSMHAQDTDTTATKAKRKRKSKAAADTSATATPAPASTPAAAAPPASPAKKAAPAPINNASDGDIASAKASGKVWVNTESGVYHKGGRWYGKTKQGKFMSEDDAKKAGYHAAKAEIGVKKT